MERFSTRQHRLVLSFLGLTLWTIGLNSCHSALYSDLTVPPGSQFVLGGNQRGVFTVQARNKGEVPVMISERRTDGQTTALRLFAPGNARTLRFASGSAVLIDNGTLTPARLDLTVTGDKDLSMKTTQN